MFLLTLLLVADCTAQQEPKQHAIHHKKTVAHHESKTKEENASLTSLRMNPELKIQETLSARQQDKALPNLGIAQSPMPMKLATTQIISTANDSLSPFPLMSILILSSDGDFNVGITSRDELQKLIEAKRKSGIYRTVPGFGMGNYHDDSMELLADKGNDNYAYIDKPLEARKVFVKEMIGNLFTLARDLKIQIEFNPKKLVLTASSAMKK